MKRNPEVMLTKLRARQMGREQAAKTQATKYGDYAEHCREEARFYEDVADTIEGLMDEIIEHRKEAWL